MQKNTFKTALPLAALLLGCTSVSALAADLNKTFTGLDSIKIKVASGNLILKKGTGKKVTVKMEESYNFDYNPEVVQNGKRLTIDDEDTREGRRSYRGKAQWTITVPNGMDIDFRTGSGSVEVTNLTVNLDMKSGSGSADIAGSKGEFDISTGSGSADIVDSTGTFEFSTGSGSSDIRNTSGSFDVSSGSGAHRTKNVKITGDSEFSTGSGSVKGSDLTLGADVSFSTGSGNVKLSLAKPSSHDISLSSGSGNATLDLNGTKLDGTLVMKVGKRSGKIKAPFDFDTTEESREGRRSGSITKTKVFNKKAVKVKISTGSGRAEVTK